MFTAEAERHLIEKARSGDATAFNSLVQIHQQVAYNVAYRLVGDPETAADATQDAFTSAFQNLRSLKGDAFRSWLLRIVTNRCYDLLRSRQRRPATSLESLQQEDGEPLPLPDPAESPENATLRRELSQAIESCLLELPFDRRAAVVLSDVHGLSYEEIARATGTNVGTVKSRISRGRAQMRDLLTRHRELLPFTIRHA